MRTTKTLHFEEAAIFADPIPTGSVQVSFSNPLIIPTTHATRLALTVRSSQIVTVFRRYSAASGRLIWVDAGTVLAANATTPIATPTTFELGQTVEILISNASGAVADITAWVCART